MVWSMGDGRRVFAHRRWLLLAILVGSGLFTQWLSPGRAQAAVSCAEGSSVYVVAHEDDSILFQNPALQHDIESGRCVETIFVTAGDDGQGAVYWAAREAGAEAAYAQMAGFQNTWTQTDAGVPGHAMPRFTLNDDPTVSLAFMRLPDGNADGGGFASDGFTSLQQLWTGATETLQAVDGSSSYTRTGLIDTLSALIQSAGADHVVTQDFVGGFGDGDHSDHHATAYFTEAAGQEDSTPHTLTGYLDYTISSLPANLSAADSQAKEATWFAYAPFDPEACQTEIACQDRYALWWSREYVSAEIQQPSPSSGSNVASSATVTASSQNVSTGQLAVRVVDGFTDGCCAGDYTHEWASLGEGVGAWLKLAWSSPQTLTSVTLFDRPNLDDQLTGATIVFSDGSSLPVGALPNDGSPLTLSFAAKTVTSLKLTVTGVASTTKNIGLAEIQAFTSGGSSSGSLALSGPAILTAGGAVQLSVRASVGSPSVSLATGSSGGGFSTSSSGPWSATLSVATSGGGASFYYRDTKAGNATVTASAGGYSSGTQSEVVSAGPLASVIVSPVGPVTLPVGGTQAFSATGADSFSNPVGISPTWSSTLGTFAPASGVSTTFTAASAGSGTVKAAVGGISGTASVTVSSASVNVASSATVTASSQNVSTGQLAVRVVDGFTDGCCAGDYTHEWASLGEGVGAWLKLAWSSPQTLTSVTLFDRPNLDDQLTGATIVFSDGSSLPVGALPNDGSPLTLSFAAKTVTSLKLTVTGVASTTKNIGLAEIQAFTSGGSSSGSLALSGPAILTAGGAVQLSVRASVGSPSVSLATGSSGGGFSTSSSGPWSATLSVATSGGGASFYYRDTKAGNATVTASAGGYSSGTQSEVVSAGPLASVIVSPVGPVTLPVGGTQAFSATGADSFSNPVGISPTWSSTLGTFAPASGVSTTFTAASAGSGTVKAAVGGISGTASVTVSSASVNVASSATVTASSQNVSTGQLAVRVVDGFTDGCCAGDYTHEWASLGEGVGAWLKLAWSSPQTLTSVTLFDRPNLDDQLTGATIVFSDGSSLPVGALPNDGSPLTLSFAAKTVTSLKLTVTGVASTTKNIGLAEIQAFTSGGSSSGSLALSGPAILTAGGAVQLSVRASVGSPSVSLATGSSGGGFSTSSSGPWSATLSVATSGGGASFYYRDTKAGNATVTASAGGYSSGTQSEVVSAGPLASVIVSPVGPVTLPVGGTQAFSATGADSFSNPVGISPTWSSTLGTFAPASGVSTTFTAASAGSGTVKAAVGGISGTASVTVSSASVNVASSATVTASSQNVSTGQLAVRVVDGFTDGCCAGDYTHEWASLGEGVGAWLKLAWSSPQTLTSVTLFDRPNLDDQLTGATIVFSDGSSLPVGALPNDGSPLTLSFAAKTVTSLKLTVTGVASTTKNIGLAEIQANT